MNPSTRILLFAAMLVIYAAAGLVGYWLVWPYPGIPSGVERMAILNQDGTIRPGEPIQYHSTLDVPYRVPVQQARWLVNDMVLQLPGTAFRSSGEYFDVINSASIVPLFAPPGRYYLRIDNCYQVNPLREICLQRVTEHFTVVE